MIPKINKRVITYGFSDQAEITARDVVPDGWGSSFDLHRRGGRLARLRMGVPGRHNVSNALAAAAVGLELGLGPDEVAAGMAAFKGVGRRLEVKGTAGGVTVIDDYAHHPRELQATLAALEQCWPDRRRVALFQPHRYSRTADLFGWFAESFGGADQLFLTDIYAAGEPPLDGVSAQSLAAAIAGRGHGAAEYLGPLAGLDEVLSERLRPGDVLITLGAGNVWQAGEAVLKRLDPDA